MHYATSTTLFLAALMAPLAHAVADPRPPGPAPALDYAKLGSLSLTPKQALDADARAVDMVVSGLLGPGNVAPVKPAAEASRTGTIQITGLSAGAAWLGDGSLDGDAVFAPVFDVSTGARSTVPSTTCDTLPPLFNIYGVLSPYANIPFIGISTFTGTPGAASSLDSNGGGYGFIAPSNMTNPKTFAGSKTSLGKPYGGESAVWSLNCVTRQLTASWTAADGSQVPLSFVSWSADGLVATANPAAFKAALPSASDPLIFSYIPSSVDGAPDFYGSHVAVAASGHTSAIRRAGRTKASTPAAAAATVPTASVEVVAAVSSDAAVPPVVVLAADPTASVREARRVTKPVMPIRG